MAFIHHRASITPTKQELLDRWLPSQPWGAGQYRLVGAYRFDDPAGAAGIETHVLRSSSGQLLQVPLTYRGAPLAGAEHHLVGTMEHTELGRRWVYDGCGDALYAAVLAAVLHGSAVQAVEEQQGEDGLVRREASVVVTVTGTPVGDVPPIDTVLANSDAATTVIEAGALRLVVRRRLDLDTAGPGGGPVLTGTWSGQHTPVVLAYLG